MYLYLDTSQGIVLGTLDSELSILDWEESHELKSSKDLHLRIQKLLGQVKFREIDGIFLCSGPGSYTGVRVGEGLAQIAELAGVKVWSFYLFEVPRYCGISEGLWISNAFKGEYFYTTWGKNEQKGLGKLEDIKTRFEGKVQQVYAPKNTPWPLAKSLDQLIKEHPSRLFGQVKSNNQRRTPYYYRSLDKEFTAQSVTF